jgi:hypothetical protein
LLATAVTLAIPDALVTAVVLDSRALAPLPGAENVTVTPGVTLLFASVSCTWKGDGNSPPNGAACPDPLICVMVTGGPGVLVSENVAVRDPNVATTL